MNRNLKPIKSREVAIERGRIGGIKSGEARRKRKEMRDTLQELLSMFIKSDEACDIESVHSFSELHGKNVSVEEAMLIVQIQKALKGDTQALLFIRDTSGQRPVDAINVHGEIDTKNPLNELSVEELKKLIQDE